MKRFSILLAACVSAGMSPDFAAARDIYQPGRTGTNSPRPADPSIWTGIYMGGSLAYGAGDSDATEINGPRNYISKFDGLSGSLHIGVQKQTGLTVGGIEFQAGYLGMGSDITRDVTGGTVTSGVDLGAYATLSGRLGYLVQPNLLAYGRVGVALAEISGGTTQSCTDGTLCGGAQSTIDSAAKVKSPTWGLLLGAGIERQISDRWTARLEYQFLGFREELALPPIDGPGWKHNVDVHSVNVGLSYRF